MLLAAGSAAQAQWAVTCVNCVNESTGQMIVQAINQVESAVKQVKSAVDSAKDKIVGAIQGNATSITTNAEENAKLVSQANTKTASDLVKADIDSKALPLDPCGVTAAARGGREAGSNRPTGSGRGGSSAPTAGASSEMKEVLKISSGAKASPAPEVAAAMAAKGACGTFAKGGVRETSCKDAGFSTGVSSGFPNADIRAETLFDGPQTAADTDKGVINRRLTLKPGDTAERTAVASFIRNLETPVDLRTLTKNEVNSEAGRNYMALRDSYDAAISMSSKPLRDQESLITANKVTLPVLKQLMKSEDAKFITTYLNKAYPSWSTDGISYAELMQLEAARRYLNEDWHVRMAAANEKQLQAELVQMQAFQGWTNALGLERLQQIAILQGSASGAAIRAEKMPLLVAAHKAAKR